ncbi:MAG TPA: hypothetical protein VGL95_01350, partial [Acetobacteraceae bacterium]
MNVPEFLFRDPSPRSVIGRLQRLPCLGRWRDSAVAFRSRATALDNQQVRAASMSQTVGDFFWQR